MGKVYTPVTITNRLDEGVYQRGLLTEGDVRRIDLDAVLVDTGATTLCLPQDLVDELGLTVLREAQVATATTVATLLIYEDAKITIMGRTGTFECIGLPEGSEPLLGVIPLEMLGLEPDLRNHRLRALPDTGRQSYITAPSPRIL